MKNKYQSLLKLQKLLFIAVWILTSLTITYSVFGQNQARSISVPNWGNIGYLEHLPSKYDQNTDRYPVLIFLHGAGERGNGTTELDRVKKNGPPKYIESGDPMSFSVDGQEQSLIVISPQLLRKYNSWPAFYVDLVIEHVKKTYRIDEDRIYLSGLSLGGGGCWSYASYRPEYAKKIAAMLPVCAHKAFDAAKVCNIGNSDLPVWAFHGDADRTTNPRYTREWVEGINKCSPSEPAKLTIYPGVGHAGAWQRAYRVDHELHTPNAYEWMLQHRRGATPSPAPAPTPTPPNQSPTAKGGADVNVQLPIAQVVLDGSKSSDPDGSIASYAWKQVSGNTSISLAGQNSQKLTISSLEAGDYTFELKVTDNKGATATDQVAVNIAIAPPAPSPAPNNDCGCDHVITAATPYVNGERLGVKPGDVICLQAGDYPYLNLFNFQGSAEQPLLFKNCGGQVRVGEPSSNYGIVMNNNKYFRFTGTGDSNFQYGFKVDGQTKYLPSGFAIATKSSDFEIDHLEITKVGAGVLAKTNPSCDASTWNGNYVMRNVKFHDFYIHDITGEGFYVGHTSLTVDVTCNGITQKVVPHDIEHIRVYDNIVEQTGWDGIQISRASKDCEIYNNKVYNYGTENHSSQQAGIIVGGESTGKVYNNWVEKGTGSGIQVFGTGEVTVYNNVVTNAGEDAIFSDDRSPKPMSARFINNTIVNPGRDGIRLYNDKALNNVVCNNLVVTPGSLGDYGDKTRSYLFIASGVSLTQSTNHFSATIDGVNFEDHANDDFQLENGSPAINAGINVSQYGIVEDLEGNARPTNGAYDIGAFEAVSGTSPEPAPTPEPTPAPLDKVAGLNYSYYEGEWSVLPEFGDLQAVKTGTVANFDLSVREQDSNFGVVFTGYINIPVTGEYTFVTGSDDGSKLFIDGQQIVNNDGLHGMRDREGTVTLTEGLHPIRVSYFERLGREQLNVYWKNTAHGVVASQPIPNEVLVRDITTEEAPTEHDKGLNYSYYEGEWSVLPEFGDLQAVKTGTVANFDLSVREQDSNFGVVFTGYINIPVTGEYTFVTGSDDGSKLFIDGQQIVNNDGLHGMRDREGTVTLTEGLHPIRVSYFERLGREQLNVYWKNTAHGVVASQPIPNEVLVRDITEEAPAVYVAQNLHTPSVSGRVFQINATKTSSTTTLADWYNIALDGFSGARTFSNVTDREGKASDVSITAYNGVEGSSIIGVADNQSTLAGGVYPSEVLRHAAYTTGAATITLSNLDQNNVYNVTLHGGRAGSGSKATTYLVNGVSKSLQCINNEDEVVTFENVSPDAQGAIVISFQQGGDTWGYLNAIVVEEIVGSNVRTAESFAGKLTTEDELGSLENSPLEVNVYPNPFAEHFTLDLSAYQDEEVTVTLFDQVGNVLMTETVKRPWSGSTWQAEIRPELTHSGVHVLRVQSVSRGTQMTRIVSQ